MIGDTPDATVARSGGTGETQLPVGWPTASSVGRRRLRLAVLGSTGSIGRQALDVARRFPSRVEVVALAARSNADSLVRQAEEFEVHRVALADPIAARSAARSLVHVEVEAGADAVADLARLGEVDVVLNALVGAAGLRSTLAALDAGKRLALANKESLVSGGGLVTAIARPGALIPVDSEHSAVFQLLVGEEPAALSRVWLTASGGPFLGMTRSDLENVSLDQALRHPRWEMGPKITIDSATLMNKGLEVIEAHHLFRVPYDRIRVVVHPQSAVHSMVELADGSVKAHLGPTDMRFPIQFAMSHPRRWDPPLPPLELTELGSLQFSAPDTDTFPALRLAYEAGMAGGTMPAVLNAANEVAVDAFLQKRCRLVDIDATVEGTMRLHPVEPLCSVEQIEGVDEWARKTAARLLGLRHAPPA